jgi:hypothetical protein
VKREIRKDLAGGGGIGIKKAIEEDDAHRPIRSAAYA